MSYHVTAEQNHHRNTANKTLKVAKFIQLGMMATKQNCIHDEIKGRMNSDNLPSKFRNYLSSHLVSKIIKIKL
jgi:hypothetical protein